MRETYRTKDGQADYGFSFERQSNGEWRAYIESQPSYNGRATDGHSTHRYNDGRPYICWSEPVRSESSMKEIAAQWADSTQRYIKYGDGF